MALNYDQVFKEIVENIFNRWTALKMAVEHGMGEHKIAIEIMEYITQYCLQNSGLSQSDIEDCLEEMMEQEFETICEDGSIKEMSALLLKYITMLTTGRVAEIEQELSQLPPNVKWLCPGAPIKYVPMDDCSDDEGIDDEQTPHRSGNTRTVEPSVDVSIDFDPEWTTVGSKRKK